MLTRPVAAFDKNSPQATARTEPADLLGLMFSLLSQADFPALQTARAVRSSVGQFGVAHLAEMRMLEYLLLLPERRSSGLCRRDLLWRPHRKETASTRIVDSNVASILLGSLTIKCQGLLDKFQEALSNRTKAINIHAIREVAATIFVCEYILATIGSTLGSRTESLHKTNTALLKCLCEFIPPFKFVTVGLTSQLGFRAFSSFGTLQKSKEFAKR